VATGSRACVPRSLTRDSYAVLIKSKYYLAFSHKDTVIKIGNYIQLSLFDTVFGNHRRQDF